MHSETAALIAVLLLIILVACWGYAPPGPTRRRAASTRSCPDGFGSVYPANRDRPTWNYGMTAHDNAEDGRLLPDSHSPSRSYFPDNPEPRSTLYSTADVDPIVTGQLYAHRDFTRDIYGGRMGHGDKHGLAEFGAGVPGEVGVDVGPYGFYEYSPTGVEWTRDIGYPQYEGEMALTGRDSVHRDVVRTMYGGEEIYSPAPLAPDVSPLPHPDGQPGRPLFTAKSMGYDDGIPENWRFPSTPIRWYKPFMRDYYGPEGPTVWDSKLYSLTEPDHEPNIGADPS